MQPKRYFIALFIVILLVLPFFKGTTEDTILITVYVGEGCTTDVTTPPVLLPRHVSYFNVKLVALCDLSDVNATLVFDPDQFTFENDYPATDIIGSMVEDEEYTAKWMVATPDEGTYSATVTVDWGADSYTADAVEVTVDNDIYGFEQTTRDISDALYAYTDKTYSSQVSEVCHNDVLYIRATGDDTDLTDNGNMDGFFHLVYDGETYDTIVTTIEKNIAVINNEICVEIDLSNVEGGKLREGGSYYIHMCARDNLRVNPTSISGTSQTFTYDVCEGSGINMPRKTVPPKTPTKQHSTLFLLQGFFIQHFFWFLLGSVVLFYAKFIE